MSRYWAKGTSQRNIWEFAFQHMHHVFSHFVVNMLDNSLNFDNKAGKTQLQQ